MTAPIDPTLDPTADPTVTDPIDLSTDPISTDPVLVTDPTVTDSRLTPPLLDGTPVPVVVPPVPTITVPVRTTVLKRRLSIDDPAPVTLFRFKHRQRAQILLDHILADRSIENEVMDGELYLELEVVDQELTTFANAKDALIAGWPVDVDTILERLHQAESQLATLQASLPSP